MEAQANKSKKTLLSLRLRFFLIKRFIPIVISIVLFTIIGGYFFLIKPERDKIMTLNNKIQELDKQFKEKSEQITIQSERIGGVSKVNLQRMDTIEKLLPPLSQLEEYSIVMNNVAEDMGVILDDVKMGEPISISEFASKRGGYYKENFSQISLPIFVVSISIQITSNTGDFGYQKIKSLLDEITAGRRIFNISSIQVGQERLKNNTGRPDEAENRRTMNLNFDTFFRR